MTVCQKLNRIIENRMRQKKEPSQKNFNKKSAPTLSFLIENQENFLHR